MKLNHLILSVILLFGAILSASAQQLTATQVLSKSTQRINNAKAIEAIFTAVASDGSQSEGELSLCREKFRMSTNDYKVWYNGSAMWSYYTRNGEVSLTEPTADELIEINPFDIINQYDTNYKAALASHQNSLYTISLTPISKASAFKSATIAIDQNTWLPKSINAAFNNGSSLTITIQSIKELATLPSPSSYEFPYSQYPTLPIIDLR